MSTSSYLFHKSFFCEMWIEYNYPKSSFKSKFPIYQLGSFLYILSGLGILVKPPDPKLFRRFFLLATKVARCREEIWALLIRLILIQLELRHEVAEILWQGLLTRRRPIRSLAEEDTFMCSSKKEKSQRRMLLIVSSSESSMKGDIPHRRM